MSLKDVYDYRIPWTPSKERYSEYQKREVEMAIINLRNCNPSDTLHSKTTVSQVKAKAVSF